MARLGLLGPGIVIAGLALGGVGVWYMVHAKPTAGDVIDTIPVDANTSFVVRAESGGERSFLELRDGDDVRWQALIPHYAGSPGRPGIAWGHDIVTVRVERDNRQEVWVLSMRDMAKLADLRLAPEHEPIPPQVGEPLTLTDHIRSYELVTGDGWHQLVAIDLSGKALWKVELGPQEITKFELHGGQITLDQRGDYHRLFNVFNGRWYFPDQTRTNPAAPYAQPL